VCPPYNFEQLLKKNGVHAGIFYPKAAWEDAGGYPVSMGRGREDWAFNVALGLKGWCGVKCDTPGSLYRREGQNRTMVNTSPEHRRLFFVQMLALYPDIYRGHRPMGCCGGKSSPKLNGGGGSRMATVMSLPGAKDGFEILEYIGGNAGDMTWYGPVSRTRYVLGGVHKVGAVDKRDVDGMVALVDQGAKAFRVYQKAAELPSALPEMTAATVEADGLIGDFTPITVPFDPSMISVSALKSKLDGLNPDELDALLLSEKQGLNRKGAIAAIESAIYGTVNV